METFNTLFVGQVLHNLAQVASTNEFALDLLSKSKPPEGTAILTFCQTAGRGQIGSRWESEPEKNISLSLILYPDFLPVQRQFLLSQAVALAVCELVEEQVGGAEVKVKWPNDVYIGQMKTAGILLQNALSGSVLRSSVVGIGINVNQTSFSSALPNPTSLRLEAGKDFLLEGLVARLFHLLELRYLQLKTGKFALLRQDYLNKLYLFGVLAPFQRPGGEVFHGTIRGVEESGRLLVEVGHGIHSFDLKELSFLAGRPTGS